MLGGGTFVTQNKILPGAYINFVSASKATATLGERGTVAIALPIGFAPGTVISITNSEFLKDSVSILGVEYNADHMMPLREIFCKANKAYIYDLGNGVDVMGVSEIRDSGTVMPATDNNPGNLTIGGYAYQVDGTTMTNLTDQLNAFINAYNSDVSASYGDGTGTDGWIAEMNDAGDGVKFMARRSGPVGGTGPSFIPEGTNVIVSGADPINGAYTTSEALAALEAYDFNVLCAYTDNQSDVEQYMSMVKSWRDDFGKKCQVVVYNQNTPDHEGIINVVSTVSNVGSDVFPHSLVAWVAGAEAGCEVHKSCTNMMYNGELSVITDKTQSQLEQCIADGQIVFHLVYGDVRVLEDINSLKTTTDEKGEDFKANQTIRVIDQIGNDIAKLFNTKYLGQIPNNASGRISLWADIVSHHRQLEEIQAIQDFDATLVTVEQGRTKKSVVVNDVINVVGAMAQLYLTVVVE